MESPAVSQIYFGIFPWLFFLQNHNWILMSQLTEIIYFKSTELHASESLFVSFFKDKREHLHIHRRLYWALNYWIFLNENTWPVCLRTCSGQTPGWSMMFLMVFTRFCGTPPQPWNVGEPWLTSNQQNVAVTGSMDCTHTVTLHTSVTVALLGHGPLCLLCEMAYGEDHMARPWGWSPASCQKEP